MIPPYNKVKILDGGWKSIDIYIYTLMEKVNKREKKKKKRKKKKKGPQIKQHFLTIMKEWMR